MLSDFHRATNNVALCQVIFNHNNKEDLCFIRITIKHAFIIQYAPVRCASYIFPQHTHSDLCWLRRKKAKIYSRNSLLLGQPLREVKVCICACVGGCLSARARVCVYVCMSNYREEW